MHSKDREHGKGRDNKINRTDQDRTYSQGLVIADPSLSRKRQDSKGVVREDGIPFETYYTRLRKVRKAAKAEELQSLLLTVEKSTGIRITTGGD